MCSYTFTNNEIFFRKMQTQNLNNKNQTPESFKQTTKSQWKKQKKVLRKKGKKKVAIQTINNLKDRLFTVIYTHKYSILLDSLSLRFSLFSPFWEMSIKCSVKQFDVWVNDCECVFASVCLNKFLILNVFFICVFKIFCQWMLFSSFLKYYTQSL